MGQKNSINSNVQGGALVLEGCMAIMSVLI